jgi:hypothetical protein
MGLPRGVTSIPGVTPQVRVRTFWGSPRGGGLQGLTLTPQVGQPTRVGSLLVWITPSPVPQGGILVRGYLFRLGTLLGYF